MATPQGMSARGLRARGRAPPPDDEPARQLARQLAAKFGMKLAEGEPALAAPSEAASIASDLFDPLDAETPLSSRTPSELSTNVRQVPLEAPLSAPPDFRSAAAAAAAGGAASGPPSASARPFDELGGAWQGNLAAACPVGTRGLGPQPAERFELKLRGGPAYLVPWEVASTASGTADSEDPDSPCSRGHSFSSLDAPSVPEAPLSNAASSGSPGCASGQGEARRPPSACACPCVTGGAPTNVGSQLHGKGQCTPCKFFRGSRGCVEGERCKLCHFPHDELSYSAMRKNLKKISLGKRRWYEAQAQARQQQARGLQPGGARNVPISIRQVMTTFSAPLPPLNSIDPDLVPWDSLAGSYLVSL